jgi:hypothetical protein
MIIISSSGVPGNSKARRYAREIGAMKAIQNLHLAQAQYFSQYFKFAGALSELGPPDHGTVGPSAAGLISATLANGENSGYKFVISLTLTGYTINASPLVFSTTGSRTFFSDESTTIHQHYGQKPATTADPEVE